MLLNSHFFFFRFLSFLHRCEPRREFSTLSFCVLLRLSIKGTKSYSATLHSSETFLAQLFGTLPQLLFRIYSSETSFRIKLCPIITNIYIYIFHKKKSDMMLFPHVLVVSFRPSFRSVWIPRVASRWMALRRSRPPTHRNCCRSCGRAFTNEWWPNTRLNLGKGHSQKEDMICFGIFALLFLFLTILAVLLIAPSSKHRERKNEAMNADSSRSHMVFTVRLNPQKGVGAEPRGRSRKLTFCDLGGCERLKRTHVVGDLQKEARLPCRRRSVLAVFVEWHVGPLLSLSSLSLSAFAPVCIYIYNYIYGCMCI